MRKLVFPLFLRKDALKNNNRLIIFMGFAITIFILWHIFDERRLMGGMFGIMSYILIWIAIPYNFVLIGILSKRESIKRGCRNCLLLLAILSFGYAVGGSTEDRIGAQHIHLILVPLFMLIVFLSFLALAFVDYIKTSYLKRIIIDNKR